VKKFAVLLLALCLLFSAAGNALAADESVEGTLVIYSSMYQFVLDMLDDAIHAEFPNLKPGNGDSYFIYGGTSRLINRLYGEMEEGVLECDMLLVAEPALSLELKEADYLEPVDVPGAADLLRFSYDEEGYWYPVRVCNMVLAYNPEMEAQWAAQGVTIPKTFKDFAMDRSLKGFIAMGDPMSSGTTFAAIASLTQSNHYGRQYLKGLAENRIQIISGSESIKKLRSGEIAAAMILEESVLKALRDAEDSGDSVMNLACIYPEDGVILIPSTVMTVRDEHSANKNAEACKAVERWLLSEKAQKLVLEGFMHSVFRTMEQVPVGSIDTNELIRKTMDVNWENVYRSREEINLAWMDIVANHVSTDE
jgi:iron(III) transport system substrate-binding protein